MKLTSNTILITGRRFRHNVEQVKFRLFAEATGFFDKALQMSSQLTLPSDQATNAKVGAL